MSGGGLAGFVERQLRLVRELGKFGTVGALTYALDTATLNYGLSLHLNPLLAKTISTTIAATAAFIGNRYWTWRDRPRSGLRRSTRCTSRSTWSGS